MDTTKHTGVVKFYGTKGAWGFITPDHGGPEMFVHVSAVGQAGLRELTPGMRVEYSVELDERSGRPCAANLRLI
jgi:CspA family cold shock protein